MDHLSREELDIIIKEARKADDKEKLKLAYAYEELLRQNEDYFSLLVYRTEERDELQQKYDDVLNKYSHWALQAHILKEENTELKAEKEKQFLEHIDSGAYLESCIEKFEGEIFQLRFTFKEILPLLKEIAKHNVVKHHVFEIEKIINTILKSDLHK